MTDDADRAEADIEIELDAAIHARKREGPIACGACHYCGEPLRPGLRWCDRSCEAMWEYETDRMAQNGNRPCST